MSAPPNAIADQLAEALRELKGEVDDPDIEVREMFGANLIISPRTERLVGDALRAHDGARSTRST